MASKELQEQTNYRNAVLFSLIFVIPTFFIFMIIMMFFPSDNILNQILMSRIVSGVTVDQILGFALATPMQFWFGARFYVGAYKALWYAGTANVDFSLFFRWMF